MSKVHQVIDQQSCGPRALEGWKQTLEGMIERVTTPIDFSVYSMSYNPVVLIPLYTCFGGECDPSLFLGGGQIARAVH